MRTLGIVVVVILLAVMVLAIIQEPQMSIWKGVLSLAVIVVMFVIVLAGIRG